MSKRRRFRNHEEDDEGLCLLCMSEALTSLSFFMTSDGTDE